MPLVWWVISRSSTAQTRVRQLVSPGEAAHHVRAAFDLAERALEQIRAAPSAAVSDWVSQMHHQGVEVIGEAAGGGGEPAVVEVVDQRLEPLLGVGLADRLVERLPVGVLDAFAFAIGQLGVQVPGAVNAAALSVGCGPALLDRLGECVG